MSASIENATKIWTETELEALPEDGYIHEVVSGELVMSPKNNWEHGEICARLLTAMKTFADAHRLGAVWDSSSGFWMANRNCRAPDLAVEILAPSLTRRDLDERLKDFFSSGTQLAWLIDPSAQRVEICRSLIQRRLLGPDGVLDGEQVLPGFQYRVVDLFKEWEW